MPFYKGTGLRSETMTLDLIKQNAKSLLEAIYTYDRLTLQNGGKKEIEKAQSYIRSLLESIKKTAEEERKLI